MAKTLHAFLFIALFLINISIVVQHNTLEQPNSSSHPPFHPLNKPLSVNIWNFTLVSNYNQSDSLASIITGGQAFLIANNESLGYWKLNENSGTNASDSSPEGFHGNLTNMDDSDWVTAKLGNGLSMDGIDDFIDLGDILDFNNSDPFSVEFWIKTLDSNYAFIVAKKNTISPFKGWGVFLRSDGTISFIKQATSINRIYLASTSTIHNNLWRHIVITYEGNSAASGVKIYIDGSEDTTTITDDTLTLPTNSSVDLNFGSRNNGVDHFLLGTLDEIIIYNHSVSSSQVSKRYNSGSGIDGIYYPTTTPSIHPQTGLCFGTAYNFTTDSVEPANTDIRFVISNDNGTNWNWFNGTDWTSSSEAWSQTNSASEINDHLSTFPNGIFLWKSFLRSTDGIYTPLLNSISFNSTGFPSTSTTTSTSTTPVTITVRDDGGAGTISTVEVNITITETAGLGAKTTAEPLLIPRSFLFWIIFPLGLLAALIALWNRKSTGKRK
jgi:hypothetical protein